MRNRRALFFLFFPHVMAWRIDHHRDERHTGVGTGCLQPFEGGIPTSVMRLVGAEKVASAARNLKMQAQCREHLLWWRAVRCRTFTGVPCRIDTGEGTVKLLAWTGDVFSTHCDWAPGSKARRERPTHLC